LTKITLQDVGFAPAKLRDVHRNIVDDLSPLFQGVNLSLSDGDKVFIDGERGVGKTVLLKCISKILPPTSGQVFIEGKFFLGIQPLFGILPRATLKENIFLRGAYVGLNRTYLLLYLQQVLESYELHKYENSVFGNLPQPIKAQFLLASLHPLSPEILILDQWFVSSDECENKQVNALLVELIQKSKITVTSIPRKALMKQACNRFFELRDKSLFEDLS